MDGSEKAPAAGAGKQVEATGIRAQYGGPMSPVKVRAPGAPGGAARETVGVSGVGGSRKQGGSTA